MQLFSVIVLLLGANGLMASPFPGPNPSYVEIGREIVERGHIVYYAPPPGSELLRKATSEVDKRQGAVVCNRGSIVCSSHNGGRFQDCDPLIADLDTNARVPLPQSPRQICFINGGNACCVSWSKPVARLTKGDLLPHVRAMRARCTQNNISGKKSQVLIDGVCTDICLSNRGTHC